MSVPQSRMSRFKTFAGKIPLAGALARKALTAFRAFRGSRRIARMLRAGSPLRIVVGARDYYDKGWIPTDVECLDLLERKDWDKYFAPDSIEAILAEHVWEHLTREQAVLAAANCREYLRPGGYLRVAVPDGCHPDPEYIRSVGVGGTGRGASDHKVLYDFQTLGDLFREAGFRVVLLEYFDREGKFHRAEWDPSGGTIRRSLRFDARNSGGIPRYTSIVLDAFRDS